MQLLNIILCVGLLILTAAEAKRAITNFKQCKEAIQEVKTNKQNVEEVKDYTNSLLLYVLAMLMILGLGIFCIIAKDYMNGIMFILFIFIWPNFILDSICNKTVLFYESGFLYCGKQYKYRNVQSIEETTKFARGHKVNVIGGDEVYITKKMVPILKQKLKEQKDRKKK